MNLRIGQLLRNLIKIRKDPEGKGLLYLGLFPALGKWLFKLPLLLLYVSFGALVVPVILCSLTLLSCLALSPIWLAFFINNNINNPLWKNTMCCIVIILYPLLSLAMTLFFIAYVLSFLLFRNGTHQDIYQPIEIGILRYVVRFLFFMHHLTNL